MGPSAESDARVQIFSEGDFHDGSLTWGWQCFTCREEEGGYGSATRAGEERDNHASICDTPPDVSNPTPAPLTTSETREDT